jgi:hypothetical protein
MTTLLASRPAAAAAATVHERTDVAVVVGGAAGWEQPLARLRSAGVAVLEVGQPGSPGIELLRDARTVLVGHALDLARPTGHPARALEPGEAVYHRKVGDSGGNYDRFHEGSPTPCSHGAASYRRFAGADKAVKGMQRRYTNFSASMLYHCSKYPNCGVYCARRDA